MKNMSKVTNLGILIAVCLLTSQCIMPHSYRDGGDRGTPSSVVTAQKKREALEARAEDLCRVYRTGDLARSRAVLGEVLAQAPHHPQALLYKDYLERIYFCTLYPGDTLSDIARYYYEDGEWWSVLARANEIDDPSKLKSYQRLRVPYFPTVMEGKDELARIQERYFNDSQIVKILAYAVKDGDNLRALARKYYHHDRFRFLLADYNGLNDLDPLEKGSLLKIPVVNVPNTVDKQDQDSLQKAMVALKDRDYEKAYRHLNTISRNSPVWTEARHSLKQCRTEGKPYYEALGDQAFEASKAKEACKYWRAALVLDPKNRELQRKLEEAKDLVRTLEMLQDLP